MSSPQDNQVRKRRVFYIPGYDPIHPRRYRELYRKEGAEQAKISGYSLDLKAKLAGEQFGWTVDGSIEGASVQTEFDVLVWSDIVKNSMSSGILATYGQMLRTAWVYMSSGALWRLMKLRKGPVIAALYPVGALLALALLTVLLTWVGAKIGGAVGSYAAGAGAAVGAMIGFATIRWVKAQDGRFYIFYLMHDYSYSARYKGACPPELDQRITDFAEQIGAALSSDVDEVLVIGHSSGAHIAVSALTRLIRSQTSEADATLSFLSLGQVVPMVSFLPDAQDLRRDLQTLSESSNLTWVDVTAPGDGCAFALCDPVAVSGVATAEKKWPLVLSAAFTQTLSPDRWAELRWRFFRLHFQYLCAFDRPGSYDYFRITARPMTLGARYKGRKPSKSRIDHSVSKFTSVLAT